MGINTHIRCWASYACTTTPDHGWAAWPVRRAPPEDVTLPHPPSVPTRRHDIRIPGLPGHAHACGGRGGEALVGRRLPALAAGVPSWGKARETTPRQSGRRRVRGRLRCDIDHITGRLSGVGKEPGVSGRAAAAGAVTLAAARKGLALGALRHGAPLPTARPCFPLHSPPSWPQCPAGLSAVVL